MSSSVINLQEVKHHTASNANASAITLVTQERRCISESSVKEIASRLFSIRIDELAEISNETIYSGIYLEDKIKRIAKLNNFYYSRPLVNVDEDCLLFEWWCKSKKISFFVFEGCIDFIKVWGPDIHTEMEEGVLSSRNHELNCSKILLLWQWISS